MRNTKRFLWVFVSLFLSSAPACAPSVPSEEDRTENGAEAMTEPEIPVETAQEIPPDTERQSQVDLPDLMGFAGEVAIVGGIPEGWPATIPIMPGFAATSAYANPLGGISARFEGSADPVDIETFYDASLGGWEKTEPPPALSLIKVGMMLSYVKGDDVLDVTSGSPEAETVSYMTLSYNWRMPPGELPPDWPDDIPLVPQFDIKSASVGPFGEMDVILSGSMELEGVAEYYSSALGDWTRADPIGTADIRSGQVAMVYERAGRNLVIRAVRRGGTTLVAIRLQDTV